MQQRLENEQGQIEQERKGAMEDGKVTKQASCLRRRSPEPPFDGFEPRQTSTADVEDMETAAVARAAARRRVPFLAVRAGSDGAGDPLGDRGFPAQFFDYYRLAAHNAGDVTRAVIAELGRLARDRSSRTCRLLAARRWRSAAKRIAARSNG